MIFQKVMKKVGIGCDTNVDLTNTFVMDAV